MEIMHGYKHYLTLVGDNVQYADILHRKGFAVNMRLYKVCDEYNDVIRSIIKHMKYLLSHRFTEGRINGISGANIGIPLNIIIIRNGLSQTVMINPMITKKSKRTMVTYESCGSIPSTVGSWVSISINRPLSMIVKYYDETGTKHTEKFTDRFIIKRICHEVDHNLGILITDER